MGYALELLGRYANVNFGAVSSFIHRTRIVKGLRINNRVCYSSSNQFTDSKVGSFFQDSPVLQNPYKSDPFLKSYLKLTIPSEYSGHVTSDLEQFGDRVCHEIDGLGRQCELNPPTLRRYNAWGKRVDEIQPNPAWVQLKSISAEEGLIAIGFERNQKEYSRLYQMAKLYLFGASSGLYGCPLAMTDGAASVIEHLGFPRKLQPAYERLTSREPEKFWTSGQWMSERGGGSDVADGTDTHAVQQDDGSYRLYGHKWFSSAADSDMAMTLARCEDSQGNTVSGTRGLSMFYLELRDQEGQLQNISVERLKDKLGTRQLATAELLLCGTRALKISETGRGVSGIASMLTISRIHNVVFSAAYMRRVTSLAYDYSRKRRAFSQLIGDLPQHARVLADMEVQTRGATALLLELARLLGRMEMGVASESEIFLLRLLTPVSKLFTGKQVVSVVSEGLECFGGQGYIEDTDLPRLLRDAQVLPIWEGTTSVLALDVLRSVKVSGGKVLQAFTDIFQDRLSKAPLSDSTAPAKLQEALQSMQQCPLLAQSVTKETSPAAAAYARDIAFSLGRLATGILLVEHAHRTDNQADKFVCDKWCRQSIWLVETEGDSNIWEKEVLDCKILLRELHST